jgi:hypothetical protein
MALLTVDGVYSAVDFCKKHTDKKLSESQVINTNCNLYKVGMLERYAYYGGSFITYTFLSTFVFNCDITIMKYAVGLSLLPVLFNNMVCGFFGKFFDKIIKERNDLVKKICCTQTANIIMQLKKIYFGNSTQINKQEIISALENLENIKSELWIFGKRFILVSFLIYLRNEYRVPYKFIKWTIVKFIYGEDIKQTTIEDARLLFEDVINNKKYDQITKPMFIQAMIYLCNAKGETGGLTKYFKKFTYKVTAMCALISIGSIPSLAFGNDDCALTVIMILSTVLIFTRKVPLGKNIVLSHIFKNKNDHKILKFIDDRTVISTILTVSVGLYYSTNVVLLSFINQFSGILLFNILMFNLIKVIYVNTHAKIISIVKDMHFSYITIGKYMCIVMLYHICTITKYSQYVVYMIPVVINFIPRSKMFKYLYPLLFVGLVNNNSYVKMLGLSYILSIIDNFIIKRHGNVFMSKTISYPVLKVDEEKPDVQIFGRKTVINSNYFNKSNIKTVIKRSIKSNITKNSALILPNPLTSLMNDSYIPNIQKEIQIDYTTPSQNINFSKCKSSKTYKSRTDKIDIDYTKPFQNI